MEQEREKYNQILSENRKLNRAFFSDYPKYYHSYFYSQTWPIHSTGKELSNIEG
jgi:hypothetical protein